MIYVDSDTGEVYLEKGQRADSSSLHPQHRATKDHWWKSQIDSEEDYDYEDDEVTTSDTVHAHDELMNLISKFADDHAGLSSELNVAPEDAAADLADNFFHLNPRWETLARAANLRKWNVKDMVKNSVYAAMVG